MIQLETLKMYDEYEGWYDGYVLKNQKEFNNSNEWFLLDDLISESLLVFKGLSSNDFENTFFNRLDKHFENKETVIFFSKIVMKKLKNEKQ